MPVTKICCLLVAAAIVAVFLAQLPRLTFNEKRRAFFLAIGAFPVVGAACYLIAGTIHHEAYQASAQALPENGSGLAMLSGFVGLVASALLLWGASHLNSRRTYDGFLEAQRQEALAIERAKVAEREHQERMLQGQTQLAQLEVQKRQLALENLQAALTVAQANMAQEEADAALRQAEQALIFQHKRYCLLNDATGTKSDAALDAEFRRDLAARRIGKIDLRPLQDSQNPKVLRILNGGPAEIDLTPQRS